MRQHLTLPVTAVLFICAGPSLADGDSHPHRHAGNTMLAALANQQDRQTATENADMARGSVYLDWNQNGSKDSWERGIEGVSVSNGLDVVQTNSRGHYEIPLPAESILFITKPAGYRVPVDENQLPQFYYVHYPEGTPDVAAFDFPVIEPTGPLPQQIDFALLPGRDTHKFKAMAFADTQAASEEDQDMIREDIVNPLIDNPFDAKFGITVGDVVNDSLNLYPRHVDMMSKIGIPMWNLPGNHDMNFRSPNDRYATETFKRYFGPTNYSFDYGRVHFVALDNVQYKGDGQGTYDYTNYRGYLTDAQLEWLRNDLAQVPKHKLLVIATHIPLVTYGLDAGGERKALGDNINTANVKALLEVIEPFRHVYGMAGHDTSNSWKVEVNHEHGWHGYPFIAHTLAEARGNGWPKGPRDERGVRSATMQDGNPNGYYVMTFEGTDVKPKFLPASGNPAEPMRISLDPMLGGTRDDAGEITAINRGTLQPGTKVVVNLFDGGKRDTVRLSLDKGEFVEMERVLRTDPFSERQYERYEDTEAALSAPVPSAHIWEFTLPTDLEPGLHTIRVRAKDEFGQRTRSAMTFEVTPE